MQKASLTILLLEDVPGVFRKLKDHINTKLGELVNVHPSKIDSNEDFENHAHLMVLLEQKQFKKIVEYYQLVDIFIIDNEILSEQTIGEQFRAYLREVNYREGNYKIIFATNTEKNSLKIEDWDNANEEYIGKKGGNINADVVNAIIRVGGISNSDLPNHGKNLYTFGETLHLSWEFVSKKFEFIIDKIVILAFYLLILAATVVGTGKVLDGFYKESGVTYFKDKPTDTARKTTSKNSSIAKNGLPNRVGILTKIATNKDSVTNPRNAAVEDTGSNPQQNSSVVNQTDLGVDETDVLRTAEHIYIYLLPIFIVFGFYNYYKGYIRRSLLSQEVGSMNEGTSTKAMKLTKVLFVSSIISYVLIKLIPEIFTDQPNVPKLISAGIFMIILIFYFWFLEKDSHQQNGKNEAK